MFISALKVVLVVYEELLSDVTVTCGVVFVSLAVALFDTRIGECNVVVLTISLKVVCSWFNTVECNVSDVLFILVSRTVLVVEFAFNATIGIVVVVSASGFKIVVLTLPVVVLGSEDERTAAVTIEGILDLYADL